MFERYDTIANCPVTETDTLKAVAAEMMRLLGLYYDAVNTGGDAEEARVEYNIMCDIHTENFPTAHCCQVDPWSWQDFWEAYKDETGVRPRNVEMTVAQVKEWFAAGHPFIQD